ncbi:uncharacterized protein BO87DRAFT_192766 [Aspergillus neoniger CBS 115656]|uniref:Uncharacterized protein n=1 Tax=Aspergillus neoniger (strain CBS 115656) TaxID=1448310 RepID=A0A318ZCH3_ASPNB|nr:hypothetical protein BO87DRAFT_192766 [Aspergillus neoniger CBS 115656]PYH37988.1 hypothetical protein BO87DRAFT_192766 [Aspergillus neoniger CBS 115656]
MLAQGKSAGLITRRSLDRNQDMLSKRFLFFFSVSCRVDWRCHVWSRYGYYRISLFLLTHSPIWQSSFCMR